MENSDDYFALIRRCALPANFWEKMKKTVGFIDSGKLLPRDTDVPGVNEEYIIQVSEEIEGKLPKNCLRSLAGQRVGFWALCRNWTIFF